MFEAIGIDPKNEIIESILKWLRNYEAHSTWQLGNQAWRAEVSQSWWLSCSTLGSLLATSHSFCPLAVTDGQGKSVWEHSLAKLYVHFNLHFLSYVFTFQNTLL